MLLYQLREGHCFIYTRNWTHYLAQQAFSAFVLSQIEKVKTLWCIHLNFRINFLNIQFLTIAKSWSIPVIGVGFLVTFWSKQSLKLWAGSVEIMIVLRPVRAIAVARLLLVVVLPTPPFPPTKIQCKVFWSIIFWSVPGNSCYINWIITLYVICISKHIQQFTNNILAFV
jgi:hypothetical protein